jgi:hypothetical protein
MEAAKMLFYLSTYNMILYILGGGGQGVTNFQEYDTLYVRSQTELC